MAQTKISKITPSKGSSPVQNRTGTDLGLKGKNDPKQPSPGFTQEQQRKYDLEGARQKDLDKTDLKDAQHLVDSTEKPRKSKYFFGWILAGIADALDIVTALLEAGTIITVIGPVIVAAIATVVDLVIDFLLLLLGFNVNKKTKKNQKASEGLNSKIINLNSTISQYRNAYAQLLRRGRKIKALRKPIAKLAGKVRKLRKIIPKKILAKNLIFMGMDLIPLLEVLPMRMYGVYTMYRAEKKSYRESQLVLQDYIATKREEMDEKNAYLQELELQDYEESEQSEIAA